MSASEHDYLIGLLSRALSVIPEGYSELRHAIGMVVDPEVWGEEGSGE